MPPWTCSQFWCKHHNPGSVTRCGKCGGDKVEPGQEMQELDYKELCGDFQKGRCVRENCRYAHVRPPAKQMDFSEPCADFQKGKCNRSNCRFQHIRKDDDKSKQLCHDYQSGELSFMTSSWICYDFRELLR